MEVVEIASDNVEEFMDFIDDDTADDMSRVFYRGIGVVDDDDNPKGALIFELVDSDSDADTKSDIKLFNAGEDDVISQLQSGYKEAVYEEDVTESFYETGDVSFADALSGLGFSKNEIESQKICFPVSQLDKLPLKMDTKIPEYICSIKELSVLQYRTGIKNFIFNGVKGAVQDLAYLPLSWFEREVSACSVTDNKVDGMLLVRRTPSGELHAIMYAAFGPDYVKTLAYLLIYATKKAKELYPPDTKIVINRHNGNVTKMAQRLAPGFKGEDVFSGKRSE